MIDPVTLPAVTSQTFPVVAVCDWFEQDDELRIAVASAASPVEAAAVLEMAGVNDEAVRLRTSLPTVFALAEVLNEVGMLGRAEEEHGQQSLRAGTHRPRLLAFNGLLYVLPCLVWVSALHPLSHISASVLLLSSATVWAGTQALSELLYRRLGRGDRAGTALISGRVLVAVLAVSAAIWILWPLLPPALLPGVLGSTAVLCYGTASAVLFVLGGRGSLALVVAASVVLLSLAFWLPPDPRRALSLAAAALLAAGSMWAAFRVSSVRSAPSTPFPPLRPDAGRALLAALYGALVATLTLAPTIASIGRPDLGAWSLWAFPVVAGLGVAEAMLWWFQSQVRVRMNTQLGVRDFQRSMSTVLGLAAASYLAVTSLIIAGVLGIAHAIGLQIPVSAAAVLCSELLSMVLLFGGLLLALGGVATAVMSLAPAASAVAAWLSVDAVGVRFVDFVMPVTLLIAAIFIVPAGWHRATHLEHYS